MRQIILDTETTGLEVAKGHRIIEIAGLEMIDRKPTGRYFHFYLNPQREVEEGAMKVHGITNEFLKDKPLFQTLSREIFDFIKGAELVIHNAPFDLGFLNREFELTHRDWTGIGEHCTVLDTLVLARERHKGARNSLDALCKRYKVNNAHRTFHGALLDCQLLLDVYLAMTGGQIDLGFEALTLNEPEVTVETSFELSIDSKQSPLKVILANSEELDAHQQYLRRLIKN